MPTSSVPISYPARYAPGVAMNYDAGDGTALTVSESSPLPVRITAAAPTSGGTGRPAPLAGTAGANALLGPFVPVAAVPVWVSLTGAWSGTVRLLRSVDGGSTKLPLTLAGGAWAAFSTNACEPVVEESEASAALYLDIQLVSGTLAYRLAQ